MDSVNYAAATLGDKAIGAEHSHKVRGSIGSRNGIEGRYFIELWYERGIPVRNENPKSGT